MIDWKKNIYCGVCGFQNDEYPWGKDGELPTFDLCSCCGIQHGYEDIDASSLRKQRLKWIANGSEWLIQKLEPDNWDYRDQLKNVLSESEIELLG